MLFSTLERARSAVEICADHIREAILQNKLRPGERLPSERILADRLGVNRQTLRSALAELRAAGLLVARQGSGHVVTAFQQVAGPALLPDLIRLIPAEQKVELCADMLLIRRHVAAAALTRLAELESFDAAPIHGAITEFALLARERASTAQLAAADVALVGALLAATGSMAFGLMVNPIAQALESFPGLSEALYGEPALTVAIHEQLGRWLKEPAVEGVAGLLEALRARDRQTVERLAGETR